MAIIAEPRTRVAVLGGGVGSIIAAFELTATTELRDRFEVTVYQMGWRLGGKGASGRNLAEHMRIEEHGLHVWFGFYENAFAKMREAYVELNRTAGSITGIETAFVGCDQVVLMDPQGSGWHDFQLTAPRNLQVPGAGGGLPTVWDMALTCVNWAASAWGRLRQDADWHSHLGAAEPRRGARGLDARELTLLTSAAPSWLADPIRAELEEGAGPSALSLAHDLLSSASNPAVACLPEDVLGPMLVALLGGFRDWLWDLYMARYGGDAYLRLADPQARFFFTAFDAFASVTTGIVRDDVLAQGFYPLNREEFCVWLARHGAKRATLGETAPERSPLLRAIYDVAFAYEEGDILRANAAAGTTVSALLRLAFSYRGSILYRMQAGMGDTVFGPFYEVLVKRGVRFEFFTAVTGLGVGQTGAGAGGGAGRSIERIDISRQAEVRGAAPYAPLVDGDVPCWPNEPLWGQLTVNRAGAVDYELEPAPPGSSAETLVRGRDFDQVVLGISVGALPDICQELCGANPAFKEALASARTVATQAWQVWLRPSAAELGWCHSGNSVCGCYVEPLDTYSDMSHLIAQEDWSAKDGVHSIAYFCGVLDDRAGETAGAAAARVRANACAFLNHDAGALWPLGVQRAAGRFRWELLADSRDGQPAQVSGEARFDSQYWRANVHGSERYVLTPAGSVEKRLPSAGSGFENLVLAGDWTRNGIDAGCVEAATISGLQAAHKLMAVTTPILGADPTWLKLL